MIQKSGKLFIFFKRTTHNAGRITNKGAALILTFIIMITLTVIAGSSIFLVTANTQHFGGQKNNVLAFYLAEAGLNKAVWYLLNTAPDGSTDGSWRTSGYPAAAGANPTDPKQESLGEGAYTMWVETSGSDVLITARGNANNVLRTVVQTVTVSSSGDIEAFDYAVFATGNINFQNSEGTVNGNISTQSSLQQEDDMTLNGTATESSAVIFPDVDYDAYEALAGANVINGNHTFTAGTHTGIWFVDGKVDVNSNVIFNGTIIATGKVTLDNKGSNISLSPASPYPAIIAGGSVSGDEITNLDINGMVYAEGGINFDKLGATAFIDGSLISGGGVSMKNGSGNFILTYDADLAANPPPHFSVPGSDVSITSVVDSWGEL